MKQKLIHFTRVNYHDKYSANTALGKTNSQASFNKLALSWLLIRNLRHGEMNHFDMLPFF